MKKFEKIEKNFFIDSPRLIYFATIEFTLKSKYDDDIDKKLKDSLFIANTFYGFEVNYLQYFKLFQIYCLIQFNKILYLLYVAMSPLKLPHSLPPNVLLSRFMK